MKQSLYIFSNTFLKRKDNTLLFEIDDCGAPSSDLDTYETEFEEELLNSRDPDFYGKKNYIPIENVDSIYAFGDIRLNSVFIHFLSRHQIPMHVFNYYGSYSGTFLPKDKSGSGNILLKQVNAFNEEIKRLTIASKILNAGFQNMIINMEYYSKRGCPVKHEMEKINEISNKSLNADSVNSLLGYEGMIRNIYYSAWEKMLKYETGFSSRISRPPRGMVNALISFGNMMMYSVCLNEILRTQLSPFIGYIHQPGDNKHSLAYDIAEIFKPMIIDKVIFRMLNLGMIKEKDFKSLDGFYYMKDNPKKKFVEEINQKLTSTFSFNNKTISFKTLVRLECYELIKFIKGEKEYSPVSSGLLRQT